MSNAVISEEEYDAFRAFLEAASGIVLGDNKHYLVSSRLKALMAEYGITSYGQLLEHLSTKRITGLREEIVDAMTTNETMWFRDGYPFEVLKEILLPELAAKRTHALKIWSAAASTGQEPYSISIAISEFLSGKLGVFPGGVQISATDISPSVLAQARLGIYDNAALSRGMSGERRDRFFVQKEQRWEIKNDVRDRIAFSELNLLNSYARLGRFDIVFCRNVLIYFSHENKADILNRMAATLNPGGYLVLGSSEAPTSYTGAYQMVRTRFGVVYQVKTLEQRSA